MSGCVTDKRFYPGQEAEDSDVLASVERICALGCISVNLYIDHLKHGDTKPEYQQLGPAQRKHLLKELQAIMSVYD